MSRRRQDVGSIFASRAFFDVVLLRSVDFLGVMFQIRESCVFWVFQGGGCCLVVTFWVW